MRLPFNIVKLLECLWLFQDLCTVCSENLETVVNFQSFIEYRCQDVPPTCSPFHFRRAWKFGGLAIFLQILKAPEVHLAFGDVSKASNHDRVAKWTNLHSIPEALAKLKNRLTICVVHRCSSWLLACDDDKSFTIWKPKSILDLIVKYRDISSILPFVNSDILQRVLSIIAFA